MLSQATHCCVEVYFAMSSGWLDITQVCLVCCPGRGGTPHMKVVRMLVGNFELNR